MSRDTLGVICFISIIYFSGVLVGYIVCSDLRNDEKLITDTILAPCLNQGYTRNHCLNESIIKLEASK